MQEKNVLTEQKRDAEHEAYREEVFGPRENEVISSDKQGENICDPRMRTKRGEERSMRLLVEGANLSMEAHLLQAVCCTGCLVKNSPVDNQILWRLMNLTQVHRKPEIMGPIDPFAYMRSSSK